jgi:hypothetical protein
MKVSDENCRRPVTPVFALPQIAGGKRRLYLPCRKLRETGDACICLAANCGKPATLVFALPQTAARQRRFVWIFLPLF